MESGLQKTSQMVIMFHYISMYILFSAVMNVYVSIYRELSTYRPSN